MLVITYGIAMLQYTEPERLENKEVIRGDGLGYPGKRK